MEYYSIMIRDKLLLLAITWVIPYVEGKKPEVKYICTCIRTSRAGKVNLLRRRISGCLR